MKITNVYGMPEALVKFAEEDYIIKPNEYRATSLLKGYKEILLNRKYYDDVTVDVTQLIWMLFGKAVHYMLESQEATPGIHKENRLYMKIGNYTLSGQYDEYNEDTFDIGDYKTTSVWKILHKNFDDWYKQGCIYALLLNQNGKSAETFTVTAFLKDHSPEKALHTKDYPPFPVYKHTFDIKPEDIVATEKWVKDKIKTLSFMTTMNVDNVEPCEPEERWQQDPTFAVMKEGRKSAMRVLDTEEEAWEWVDEKVKESDLTKVNVVLRPGRNRKCESYCFFNKYCNFYQDEVVKKPVLSGQSED